MTPEERAEARRLVDAATAGPWEWCNPHDKDGSDICWYEPYTDGSTGKGARFDLITRDSGVYGPNIATCDFIIASRTLVPQLLDALEAAERERDDVGSAYVMASGLLASEQVRSADAIKERDTARAQVATLAEALREIISSTRCSGPCNSYGICAACTTESFARTALKAAGVEP